MFSITTRHALRALAELAVLPEGATLLGKDLAVRAGIPPNYLSKILWRLGGEGVIGAIRGLRGGYRLRRRPDTITLIEIVRLFDRPHHDEACFFYEDRPCSDTTPCPAHAAWSKVGQAHADFLSSTTLADIAGPPVGGGLRERPRRTSSRLSGTGNQGRHGARAAAAASEPQMRKPRLQP